MPYGQSQLDDNEHSIYDDSLVPTHPPPTFGTFLESHFLIRNNGIDASPRMLLCLSDEAEN